MVAAGRACPCAAGAPAPRQRADSALVRDLPPHRPHLPARLDTGGKSCGWISDGHLVDRDRRACARHCPARALSQRAVVDLRAPHVAAHAMGMGAGGARARHHPPDGAARGCDQSCFGISPLQRRLQLRTAEPLGSESWISTIPHCGGADRLGACLNRHSFLAAHKEMVSGLAAGIRPHQLAAPDLGDCRIHRGRQPRGTAGRRQSAVHRERAQERALHAREGRRRAPARATNLGGIFRAPAGALCWAGDPRARVPPAAAAGADPLQRPAHAHSARRDRAGDAAGKPGPARVGMWRARPLHDLPDSRDPGARSSAHADRARGHGVGAHRRPGRDAARLSDPAHDRYFDHATARRRCRRR